MNRQEFLEGLTDEQRGKALSCKSSDEFAAFVRAEKLALPDEMLTGIAGGDGCKAWRTKIPGMFCPRCGNESVEDYWVIPGPVILVGYRCTTCGYTFDMEPE